MHSLIRIGGISTVVATCFLFAAADAQEAYDIMSGRFDGTTTPTAVFEGRNSGMELRPRSRAPVRPKVHVEAASASYCVRTCDGRYFPAPSGDAQSTAHGCESLCPASETKVFYGSSIDGASSKDGKPYSALANAFRYRKELVAGCTCNGKDVVGLASVKPDEDRTLRRGDIVARETGLTVVKRVDEGVSFAKVSAATRSKYERLPVLASD